MYVLQCIMFCNRCISSRGFRKGSVLHIYEGNWRNTSSDNPFERSLYACLKKMNAITLLSTLESVGKGPGTLENFHLFFSWQIARLNCLSPSAHVSFCPCVRAHPVPVSRSQPWQAPADVFRPRLFTAGAQWHNSRQGCYVRPAESFHPWRRRRTMGRMASKMPT